MVKIGQTVYVATERAYYGRATVIDVLPDGSYAVQMRNGACGKVLPSQCAPTASQARELIHPHFWHDL